MGIDQAHEQTNKAIKGSGGAIGLFHNHQAQTQWLIVMPELSRILQEFEVQLASMESNDDEKTFDHNEQSQAFQKTFHEKVKSLYSTVKDYGNPFEVQHKILLKLVTQEICNDSVEETIQSIELKGCEQYNSYVSEVLENGTKTVHDTIPKNSYPLMSTALKKGNSTS